MSLVSYTSSSDSEEEASKMSSSEPSPPKRIFTAYPTPLEAMSSVADELEEFLKKQEVPKQPVKINIPSLSLFDSDEEEPNRKKQKMQASSSGLFAFLPPPKTNTQPKHLHIIPQILRNKNKAIKLQLLNKQKNLAPPKEQVKYDPYSESSDDDDDVAVPDTFDDAAWQKACGRPKQVVPTIEQVPTSTTNDIEPAPATEEPYQGLDNEAFKELLGTNSKQNKNDIAIIEINEDEILPDKDVWMTKSLTDPEMAPKYVVKDPVNDTCRRKHHITYLAQQAKANEQDLKNQWAQNRYSRQMTQAKYGF